MANYTLTMKCLFEKNNPTQFKLRVIMHQFRYINIRVLLHVCKYIHFSLKILHSGPLRAFDSY